MDWNVSDVFKIIALYRQYPCLWEYRSPEYKRVDLKRNAWDEISKEMGKTVEEVKKKIKYLRSAYVGEKKKAEASKLSGSASDDVYRPHLFYFNEFNFLDSVVVLRKTSSSLSKESCQVLEISPDSFGINSPDFSQDCSQDSTFSVCSLSSSTPVGDKQWKSPECSQDCSQDSTFSVFSISTSTPVGDKHWKGMKRAKIERNNKFNDALDAILIKVKNTNVDHETMFTAFFKSVAIQIADLPLVVATSTMADMQKLLAERIQNYQRKNILEDAMCDADLTYE